MRDDIRNIVMQWFVKLLDFATKTTTLIACVFLCSAILLFSPQQYLRLIRLDKLVETFGPEVWPILGLLFLLSGVLIAIKLSIFCKNQYDKFIDRKRKKERLSQLTELSRTASSGLRSYEDRIRWATSVAPLLKFNEQYYLNFTENFHHINNENAPPTFIKPIIITMKSEVDKAIADLGHELGK